MKGEFDKLSLKISELTTRNYSTSFSLGIKMLSKKFHNPIYSIYGFVRFAAEIVDGFHDYNKSKLLNEFEKDCFESINEGISMNPILNGFQKVVNEYSTTIYIEEALHRLVELHYKLGLVSEAKQYANLLGYNYKSSEWYEASYEIFNRDYKKRQVIPSNEKNNILTRFKKLFL